MRRMIVVLGALLVSMAMLAGPASAHHLVVDPPGGGNGPGEAAWVGGGFLPGKGAGLVAGGPGGAFLISPAHVKGLNVACETLRAHGKSAVDIFGPPPTPNSACAHGAVQPE